MSEWKEISFEVLYKIPSRNGLNRPSSVRGEGYKMVNMGELFGNDRIADIEMERVKLTNQEMKNFEVKEGDLLFARQSIVAEGAGKCSIIIKATEYLCFESHIIRIRLDEKKALPLFYYYLFQSQLGKSYLSTIRLQGVQAGIRGSDLGKLKILYLNIKQQHRIASILSAYDDLIENNNRRIALLEQMAEQIYKEWFVRMRFPGYENTEFEKGVPKGWEERKFTDVASVLSGGTPKTEKQEYWDGEICWFAPTDIQNSYYVLSTIKKITESGLKNCNSKLYPVNTIFITARGSVGNCVLNAVPMAMNQSCYALINKDGFGLSQFYLYLLVKDLVAGFRNVANGAVFDTITVSTFERTKIILPDSIVLQQFSNCIIPIFEQMKTLQLQTQTLKQTRDLLLPRLISGKLRVKEAEMETEKM
jgi:type I restriction enzyme S subunit